MRQSSAVTSSISPIIEIDVALDVWSTVHADVINADLLAFIKS
jgi:hypothetical protein